MGEQQDSTRHVHFPRHAAESAVDNYRLLRAEEAVYGVFYSDIASQARPLIEWSKP
jgi:hypothetical protein